MITLFKNYILFARNFHPSCVCVCVKAKQTTVYTVFTYLLARAVDYTQTRRAAGKTPEQLLRPEHQTHIIGLAVCIYLHVDNIDT